MDSEKLKIQIGLNIAALRRQRSMTQAELAERLNYTDKAVSKWERGDSVPDALTLVQLSRLFGVTLDELVSDGTPVAAPAAAKPEQPKASRTVILAMTSLLVWLIALTVYVILSSVGVPKTWVAFVYAVPINAIVLLSLRSAFRMYNWNHVLVSLIMWGCLASLYITMMVFAGLNLWRVLLLGIPGQAVITLWFCLFRTAKKEKYGQE